MSTFITRDSAAGPGVRLAVKDVIDVAGMPTTAGSPAVSRTVRPAVGDAECLVGSRAAKTRIVGKATLTELAFSASGVNPWYGTPTNPLDAALVPGGSSSGSAVAVAIGEADIAFGTDTGGSIRIPSAYCGTCGLKTTHRRIPVDGVRVLAASLDTVGPMARDVAGLVAGMKLLEPGFTPAAEAATRVGRLRVLNGAIDPAIDAAVDRALVETGSMVIVDVILDSWAAARSAGCDILFSEAASAYGALARDPVSRAWLSEVILERLDRANRIRPEVIALARALQVRWIRALDKLFGEVDVLVLPTSPMYPPRLEDASVPPQPYNLCTIPVNLAGLPALALPVPGRRDLPASLQMIGPTGSEELLLATGAVIEEAARSIVA